MKYTRLTPEQAKERYSKVDQLVTEQNISNPDACEQLQIPYSSYIAWKRRQIEGTRKYKRRKKKEEKTSATVSTLPPRPSQPINNDLLIRIAYKIPNLLADLIELEHSPAALKYIADRKDDHLLAIKNAKLALDLLGKAFSERNY